MKNTISKLFLFTLILVSFTACEYFGGGGRTFESADGISGLISGLKSQFGDNASFKSIVMIYDESSGTSVSATGTDNPSGNIMIEKTKIKGFWQDNAEITVELEQNSKLSDFIFSLDQINLEQVPGLVQQAKDKVSQEKSIDKVVAKMVSFTVPDRLGRDFKPTIDVNVEPENGGTDFTVQFNTQGQFVNMFD